MKKQLNTQTPTISYAAENVLPATGSLVVLHIILKKLPLCFTIGEDRQHISVSISSVRHLKDSGTEVVIGGGIHIFGLRLLDN